MPTTSKLDCRGLLSIAVAALTISVSGLVSMLANGSIAIADRFEAAQNAGDTQSVVLLFAEDAVVVDPGGQSWFGQAQIRIWLREAHGPAFRRRLEGVRNVGLNSVQWIDYVSDVGYHDLRIETQAIIMGGRIRHLSYRYLFDEPEPAHPLSSALRLVWGLPLVLVASLVYWPSRVDHRTPRVRREMLMGLRSWARTRAEADTPAQWNGPKKEVTIAHRMPCRLAPLVLAAPLLKTLPHVGVADDSGASAGRVCQPACWTGTIVSKLQVGRPCPGYRPRQ